MAGITQVSSAPAADAPRRAGCSAESREVSLIPPKHRLERNAMSRLLRAARRLADERVCLLVLLVVPRSGRDDRRAGHAAADLCLGEGEYWGRLVDGSDGVLMVQPAGTSREWLATRVEQLRDGLEAQRMPVVARFDYPLRSLAPDGCSGERALRRFPEGGVERYFSLPVPVWKRTLDMFAATLGLALLAPLLLGVAALVKLTSRGPALFAQRRTGRGGQPFTMYKFRSMVHDAEQMQAALRHLNEQDGPAFKIGRDPRVTRLGHWLRKTCIDELPQLWSVLRGDMSLVGPRPLPCDESAACAGWQRQRLEVLPGMTCLWQVRGRSMVSFDEWMRMDVEYIQRCSFWLDVWLLLATPLALLPRPRWLRLADAPRADAADAGGDGVTRRRRPGAAVPAGSSAGSGQQSVENVSEIRGAAAKQ